MSSYVAIGSVCWDVVEGESERRLGGSVLFASRVAVAAGWDAHIVTSGTAELEEALRRALPDVKITVQRSAHDTVMAFSRLVALGPQAVPTVADPIDVSAVDLADAADVVHLAPIMDEVTPALVDQVPEGGFVGITPQGLLRTVDPATRALLHRGDLDAWWAPHVSAAVVSEEEFEIVTDPAALRSMTLAVTRGDRGCMGWSDGIDVDLPGIAVPDVAAVGTIGAGDVFAASFFIALASRVPFPEALDRANRTAASHVGGSLRLS